MSTRQIALHDARDQGPTTRSQIRGTHRHLKRLHLLVLPAITIMVVASSCRPEPGESAIDRQTFVMVQTELRLATAANEREELPLVRRDSLLAVHGVTWESMQAFIAVHGQDEAYMTDVWREVDEQVLDAQGIGPGDVDPEPR